MLIVVTGGSGSGKSAYAEECIVSSGIQKRYYAATMICRDEESRKRIHRHRLMRADKQFETVECPVDLHMIRIESESAVLLECMSNLTANEMFSDSDPKSSGEIAEKIMAGIASLLKQCDLLVVVTNEVFSDGMCYDPLTEEYLKCLGSINCRLAELADEVVEVVYTIPVIRKNRRKNP